MCVLYLLTRKTLVCNCYTFVSFLSCCPGILWTYRVVEADLDSLFVPAVHQHTWLIARIWSLRMPCILWFKCSRQRGMAVLTSPMSHAPISAYQATWAGPHATKEQNHQTHHLGPSFLLFLVPCTQVKPLPAYVVWGQLYSLSLPRSLRISCHKMEMSLGVSSLGHCEKLCELIHMGRAQSGARDTDNALRLHWDSSDYIFSLETGK